uniref:EF-hand domain-containing protein n=1 Tax=Palpitomonas bilix TaxID=652834 RepID=A0A7S3CXN1_9EUKA|mmetsp:Transcript_11110/g.29165  ORF Transcript_11110/g.29165 Transcript_11110/m.29165 type:complete len:316 (+) Transcript_11110:106-1053(+)
MEPDEKPKKRIGGGFGGYNPDESIEVAKTDTFTGKEKFEFEDFKDAEVPYHEQGDESMYTEENLRIREKIRDDKVLTKQIHKFWSVFDMNVDGEVDKKEYTAMVIRLSKVLIPNLEEEQAVTIAEDEWETDSKGKKALNYEMFHNAVFQLVDHWTTTADVREYRNFVRVLLRRITKKVKTYADGTKVVRGPYKSMKARLRMLKRKDKHRAESARGPSPDAAPAVSTPSSTEEKKVEATTTEAEAPMEAEDPEILDESNYFEEDVESIHDEEEEMETSDEEEEEGVERMYEMVPYDEIEEASEDEDEGEEEEEEEG